MVMVQIIATDVGRLWSYIYLGAICKWPNEKYI